VDNELPPEPSPEPGSEIRPSLEAELAPSQPAAPTLAVPPMPQVSPYRDRRTGLLIFGVVQIILGLLAALMVPLAALGAFLSRLAPGGAMRPAQYLSGIATYALFAAGLLTLGAGSVQMKRWARALTVVVSWYWLVAGVLITVLLTAALPVMMRGILQAQQRANGQPEGLSAGVMAVILTIIIVFAAVFLIVVPIAFVAFYSRQDVAETCRRRDPVEPWTDRVPLPVLGACVVLGVQALYLFVVGATTPLFPFFGRYLTGIPGFAGFLVMALLDGYLAIAFFRLQWAGWWIALLAAPVRMLSMALTYARADLMQAYSKMGWSDTQIELLNSSPFFRSHLILWWSLISVVLFFGYLIWLKRYFKATDTPPARESGASAIGLKA